MNQSKLPWSKWEKKTGIGSFTRRLLSSSSEHLSVPPAQEVALLAAHTMGLGSCLIGYAVAAMGAYRSIQKKLVIPESETIHAAVAMGYPDETFQRITSRKKPKILFPDK